MKKQQPAELGGSEETKPAKPTVTPARRAETVQALCQAAARPDTHGYQPYVGIPELRAEFARWYKRWYGVDLDPANEILPLIGSKEGVMHISLAFLNEGDGVLIPNPGYPTYASVSKFVGARILPYALKEENDWQPDFEALEKMDLSGVKLMWCNYPNMPTGANGSRELFEKLVAFGRRHNIVICHDNPYSFILNDRPLSILSVPGAKEICIELNSMSKTFNMPGWRIGMVATNSRFLEWILRVKSNMDSGMFRPMQLAAVEALKAPDSWYQRMNEVYRRRRALAARILETLGCDVRDDQVGMFLWGRVNDTLAAQLTAAGECPNGHGSSSLQVPSSARKGGTTSASRSAATRRCCRRHSTGSRRPEQNRISKQNINRPDSPVTAGDRKINNDNENGNRTTHFSGRGSQTSDDYRRPLQRGEP